MALVGVLLTAALFGCWKPPEVPDPEPTAWEKKVLVLNEGLFQMNNSELTAWSQTDGQVYQQQFSAINQQGMGDTGNDVARYGGKVYVVMNVSSVVHVLDAADGTLLSTVHVKDGGVGRQPREIAFYQGEFATSNFDGTLTVFDTVSYGLQRVVQLGANPDGMTTTGSILYVSNSGGLNAPNYDSTVSVVDMNTWTELDRITVGPNPGPVHADNSGGVWVSVRGDYGAIPAELVRVQTSTNQVTDRFAMSVNSMDSRGDSLLFGSYDYQLGQSNLQVWDAQTLSVLTASVPLSVVETLYDVSYLPGIDKIAVCDANGFTNTGKVYIVHPNGTVEAEFAAGLNPSETIYLP